MMKCVCSSAWRQRRGAVTDRCRPVLTFSKSNGINVDNGHFESSLVTGNPAKRGRYIKSGVCG